MNEKKFKELIAYKYNNKYNLDNIWYRTKEYKIYVNCPLHELFDIKPSTFLESRGCPKCKDKPLEYIETKEKFFDYTKYLKENESFLYCVKLINKETLESFYKIGVTYQNIYKRLSTKYFEIQPILMYIVSSNDVYNVEQFLHNILKEYSYRPLFIQSGNTECYRIDSNIPKLVYNFIYI